MKKLIKSYPSITWIKIRNTFVRRDAIETINEESLRIRTSSGMEFSLDRKEFQDFIKQTNFNE